MQEEDYEYTEDVTLPPKLKPGVIPYLKQLDSSSNDIVGYVSYVASTSSSSGEEQGSSIDSTISSEISECGSFDPYWLPLSDASESSTSSDKNQSREENNVMKDLANKKLEVIFDTPAIVKDFFGIESDKIYLVDEIVKIACLHKLHILICLQKMKQNQPFSVLGFDYGISTGYCARLFKRTISVIAKALAKFIVWSDPTVVWHRLPIAFRANYSEVVSIIDCFEIEIQKPTNPVHQSHTWSEYKKCNTVKYLVSATPDGIVNFISEGFGGRITDVQIIKSSGFLNVLPQNSVVMADRGFKNIESLLQQKSCRLVRPPSVNEGEPMSKADVRLTKQIAALRIHIERVIKRYREFAILRPHATVNLYLIASLNEIVFVASALINIQNPLIR